MSKSGVAFRELNPENSDEVGFVYKSWLGSYKNHADVVPYKIYRQLYQTILESIIDRSECIVVLAYNPDLPDQLFGFACCERAQPTLHYIYVKAGPDNQLRRKGIGTDLLEFINEGNTSGEFKYTFNTTMGRKFLNARGGRYNPSFVRNL